MNRWIGPILALGIVAGVAGVLVWNLEPGQQDGSSGSIVPTRGTPPAPPSEGAPAIKASAGFREYPIGETERHHLSIAAVWLPAVHMAGVNGNDSGSVIHLEADVRALEGNPNGFAAGEFVPYMTVKYTITPKTGGPPITGTMMPMIARDGPHYGVSVAMPGPGDYTLKFAFDPPSANGLGRHDDPLTGVAPWWSPFELEFPWQFTPAADGSAE